MRGLRRGRSRLKLELFQCALQGFEIVPVVTALECVQRSEGDKGDNVDVALRSGVLRECYRGVHELRDFQRVRRRKLRELESDSTLRLAGVFEPNRSGAERCQPLEMRKLDFESEISRSAAERALLFKDHAESTQAQVEGLGGLSLVEDRVVPLKDAIANGYAHRHACVLTPMLSEARGRCGRRASIERAVKGIENQVE